MTYKIIDDDHIVIDTKRYERTHAPVVGQCQGCALATVIEGECYLMIEDLYKVAPEKSLCRDSIWVQV